MDVVISDHPPPRSPRSVGSSRNNSFQLDRADSRVRLILLASSNKDQDDLQQALKDESYHRSTIVRSEKLPVYVYIDHDLVHQYQWDRNDLESIVINVTLHECQAPLPIGKYYPSCPSSVSNLQLSSIHGITKIRSNPIIFPDGSVCFIIELIVGEGVYDEIKAHIQFAANILEDNIPGVDIDDLSVFRSATPTFNLLRSLSRNEETPGGFTGQQFFASLKITITEPVQLGWDHEAVDSTVFWSVRVRNRLREAAVVINRFLLLFDGFEESLACLNKDQVPIILLPDGVYCFVFSISKSCQSIPIASLTLQSEAFSSPIMYQVQLTGADRDKLPLNMHLGCPSEVLTHSMFMVTATISNDGPTTVTDLELQLESDSTDDASMIKSFLSLDKSVELGTLSSGQTATANLHFLALREGLISLSNIIVQSRSSGRIYIQERPLTILITRTPAVQI